MGRLLHHSPLHQRGPFVCYATIKSSLNTRVTYNAAYDYNRRELEKRGVSNVAEFTRIIRAHQAREQRGAAQSRIFYLRDYAIARDGIWYNYTRRKSGFRKDKEKAMAKTPYKVSMIGIIAAAAMPLFAATTRYVVPSGMFRIA